MEVPIDTEVIEKLSANGVLAYVAVKIAEGTEATTAALAGLVRCKTGNMLDGLKDVAVAFPELVAKAPKHKWRCGTVKAGAGVVLQSLDSERYRAFVDDLKKYWDYLQEGLRPGYELPFQMGGKDGTQIRQFLANHPDWIQSMWRVALNHRKTSVERYLVGSRTEPLWKWVGSLDNYAAGPLDRFGKPVEGSGNGKTFDREQRNRQGNEEYFASRL